MHYFVGWDVGGWHCDKNRKSRDALAILCETKGRPRQVGKAFHGNIRSYIEEHLCLAELVSECCNISVTKNDRITIAIDTPLGLPRGVISLVQKRALLAVPKASSENPYTYRQTEEWLCKQHFPALSVMTHMIGSQCTKGMYLLRKFDLTTTNRSCGVWKKGKVTAIECYPATCKKAKNKSYVVEGSAHVHRLFKQAVGKQKLADDREDAVYCALIAYLFAKNPKMLVSPQNVPPAAEGWIWYPADAVGRRSKKKSA
jgi:predicted nuclease with RNAse H fold